MDLRPYQSKAIASVQAGWAQWQRQLGVAATGAGKTIMFSHLAAQQPGRTLILAHRENLVDQAVEKLKATTGIFASVEQGTRRGRPGLKAIVGSVQSMRRRLAKYQPDAFDLVICDEAHHALSEEWQTVLKHFGGARVLGVTATPDRSDRKSLGRYFQNVAFEIGLLELIGNGHLSPLRALKLGVEVDVRRLRGVKAKDVNADDVADAISPCLLELARAVAAEIWDRKALIFLPRCDTSEAFAAALTECGIEARHVAGASDDRTGQLDWFRAAGKGSALCNAMLLTEGYDQPDIDCIVCLRATKSRSLYAQIVGRGTRLFPGKDFCLLIDPLWLSGEIDLCKPADLLATTPLHREKLQARLDLGEDILTADARAHVDMEAILAEQIAEAQKNRKAPKGLFDPLSYAVGIHDSNLEEYEPAMPWEEEPPTEEQVFMLTQWGAWTERMTRGFAVKLLERIEQRDSLGLATPKQVLKMRQMGEPNANVMSKAQAGLWFSRNMPRR